MPSGATSQRRPAICALEPVAAIVAMIVGEPSRV
jgi:hypothetical protein